MFVRRNSTLIYSNCDSYSIARQAVAIASISLLFLVVATALQARPFDFAQDTFSFANETIFDYKDGRIAYSAAQHQVRTRKFVQHCFVMSRSVAQFRKFARFEPSQPPLNDLELKRRIRQITHAPAWEPARNANDRVVIPGYPNLRSLSKARDYLLRTNIGLGWTTYFRVGNWRIVLPHGPAQQARTEQTLEQTLARGDYFVAYLTTFPRSLSINHAVLVYKKQPSRAQDPIRYWVYDPNHSDRPRTLEWSAREQSFSFQRDWDFVGGHVIVWQVYGRPLQ
jgi:hypothetical protein